MLRRALRAAALQTGDPAELAAAVRHVLDVPVPAGAVAGASAVGRLAPVIAALRDAGGTLPCRWDATLPTEEAFPW